MQAEEGAFPPDVIRAVEIMGPLRQFAHDHRHGPEVRKDKTDDFERSRFHCPCGWVSGYLWQDDTHPSLTVALHVQDMWIEALIADGLDPRAVAVAKTLTAADTGMEAATIIATANATLD